MTNTIEAEIIELEKQWASAIVVLMLFTQKVFVRGQDRSAQFMITDIWIRQADGWRVAERHSSRPEQLVAARP